MNPSFVSQLSPAATRIFNLPDVAQRTPEWYEARRKLITASDAAAALGIKPFPSYSGDPREDCMIKKLDNHPFNSIFCRHGQKYEDEARDLFCELYNKKAFDKGLCFHPTEHWIGASPDGITYDGELIEIKCPLKRAIIPGKVPHHYFPQIQCQAEVLDAEICYFIQYKPPHLTDDGKPILDVSVVRRDRDWWRQNRDALHAFWKEYQDRQATHVRSDPPRDPACLIDDALY